MTNLKMEISSYGTKRWYNSKGQRHRINGPAVIYKNGTLLWYVNDKNHRIDGPAVILCNGTKSWWLKKKSLKSEFVRKFTFDEVI